MITNEELQLSKMSYTDKDFASIYPDLLDLAKQLTNRWDPSLSNESDPGVVLLKEGAFIADHNNYNIDKNVLENFLPSATQDRSVRNLTEINGYTPRYYVSSTGNINFTFNGNNDITKDNFLGFTIPAYSIVVTNEDEDVTYVQVEDLKIGQLGLSTTCKFMEGSLIQLSVNNSGTILLENLDENNRIYFPDVFVAENGIFIHNVDSDYHDLWEKNDYLLTQPLDSKIYKVDYDSRMGLPYVEFPSDIANIIGNGLEINYISTTGTAGNVSANTLTKVKSPSDFLVSSLGKTVSLQDDFTILNQSSILNGKDPETIDEMYKSFKRIVGTFDTLVTRRDYENSIRGMIDDYNNKLVSNAVVTDIRTDYNNSINIITYDEYGTYFENASLTKGIYNYNFILDDSSGYTPSVGDIKFNNNEFEVYTDSGGWETITSLGYKEFVKASETMTPYDLCIYALKTFSMADYLDRSPELALNNSFSVADKISIDTIKSELNDYKCINHTFKDVEDDDIICFKNYVPLNITIIPYSKVTKEERDEIIRNIYRALTENFNASMVEFGEELNYDEVVEVLLSADDRIKNIRLEDFQYIPVALYGNGDEVEVYDNYELLVDIIAKNVLAGRLCLFNFDEEFTYGYGQVDSIVYGDIGSLSTEVEIDLSAPETPSSTDSLPEIINREATSFDGYLNIKIYDDSSNLLTSISELNPLTLNQVYTLPSDYYIEIEEYPDAAYTFPTQSTSGYNYTLKIRSNVSEYIYNPNDNSVPGGSITILEEYSDQNSSSETVDFTYSLKENEYIEITYPNYYSTVIYPVYCNYRFVSPWDTTVYSNTDYELQSGEFLYLMYTSGDQQQYDTYSAGQVINTTFNMTPTSDTVGSRKKFGSNGVEMIMSQLGASEQIAIREKLETKLSSINTPCYWIMNNSQNILFKERSSDSDVGEGYDWVILESGEYFIYSNSNLDSMVIMGSGTKIIRSSSDDSQWIIESNPTTITSIKNNGLNSNITWKYFDFTQNNLLLQELNIVTIGYPDQVTIVGWENKPSASVHPYLNNEWIPCDGTIYYKINGKQNVLKKINFDDGYLIRSRLDLVTDNYNGQKLLSGDGSKQKVIVTYSGEGNPEPITINIGPDESSEDSLQSLYLQSSISLDLIGSSNMDIGLITSDNILNFMTYNKQLPTIYDDTVGDDPGKTLISSNGKYIINVETLNGHAEFPFSYKNTFGTYLENDRNYILPVYVSGSSDNQVIASFEYNTPSSEDYGLKIVDYSLGESQNSLSLSGNKLYLLTPVVEVDYQESSEGAALENEEINLELNIKLVLTWQESSELSQSTQIISIFDPVIVNGINSNLDTTNNAINLYDVLDRINNLVASSTKPTVKPYYINDPEQSIAIQDPDISNPNIFWDKNNVVNLLTIPQIILPSDNIDIIKSMKGYSLRNEVR